MSQTHGTLTEDELLELEVGLTPQPDDTRAIPRTQSLNGTWAFAVGTDTPPARDADWRRHDVPSGWDYEGYEVDDGRGWYRREFTIPGMWQSECIRIRFDAVYSDAIVRVNGERVGNHVGGYTPFEVDVTDQVHVGDGNVVEIGVRKESSADETSQAAISAGIGRDLTLFAVPSCHVSDLDVRTELLDGGDCARVRALVTVKNDASADATAATVEATLADPADEPVAVTKATIDYLDAGAVRTLNLAFELDDPLAWNPAQPHIYALTCELVTDDATETVSERVGIRDVEVVGNDLRVNGTPVMLRGINWREADPDHGMGISAAASRRDAERLRAANINYVRTGHHPPSEAFVDACDDFGIIVEMESPIAFLRFEGSHRAEDPAYRETVCRQLLEIVERDKNHPSVCIWSLANESDWGPNFEAAARLVKDADPTRPTTFNWGMHRDDDASFCDIANHHYPVLRDSLVELDDFVDHDRPILFDEFAHLYCYNGRELGTDPGLRDDYVRVLERCWERVRDIDACAGVAIWAGLDHLSPEYRWGVFDADRRERPEYWHIKKTYSPIQLVDSTRREDGSVKIELENRSEFVSLAKRDVTWTASGDSGTLDPDIGPGETGTVTIPAAGEKASLTVRHPSGFTVNEFVFESVPDQPAAVPSTPAPTVSRGETTVTLGGDAAMLTVDTNIGNVEFADADGEVVLSGLPGLVATSPQADISTPPVYGNTVSGRLGPWRCESVTLTDDEMGVVIRGGYYYDTIDAAGGAFTYRLQGDGELVVSYDFTLRESRSARELGVVFPIDESCTTLSWTRDTYWSTYPDTHIGRQSGSVPAFPGERAQVNDLESLDDTRPWEHEANAAGSNDFRSTKRNVRFARLTNADDRGVTVLGDGTQHVRCAVTEDAVELFVLDRSMAGEGLALLDRHDILGENPELEAGSEISGSAMLRIQ